MASYKISYKMLAKQGEEIKAVAKLVDGYAERVTQIRGKLGEDQMLAEVRGNLQKLHTQLGESRAVLSTAGELLTKSVQAYTSTETRQVKKVDSLKAHNRDFYKNPVVVASAGTVGGAAVSASVAAAPAAATATPSQSSATTINYTDNSTNIQYTAAAESPAAAAQTTVTPVAASASYHPQATPAAASSAKIPSAAGTAGIGAGAGVVGGAIGAGAVMGVKHLLDKEKDVNPDTKPKPPMGQDVKTPDSPPKPYDPEAELAAAIQRVRKLEEEE